MEYWKETPKGNVVEKGRRALLPSDVSLKHCRILSYCCHSGLNLFHVIESNCCAALTIIHIHGAGNIHR